MIVTPTGMFHKKYKLYPKKGWKHGWPQSKNTKVQLFRIEALCLLQEVAEIPVCLPHFMKLKFKTMYFSLLSALERRVEDCQEIVIRIHKLFRNFRSAYNATINIIFSFDCCCQFL